MLVKQLCIALEEASSWEDFVETRRGRSYLSTEIDSIKHPAKELLRHWREHGVPVNSTSPPWTDDQKETCINQGCHKSATEHQGYLWHQPFLEDIQQHLVSGKNPHREITNSDLEHTEILAQTCLIADEFNPTYTTIKTGSDNTPAISRVSLGAISSDGAGARLCNQCVH